jgi:hypothetical protein
MNLLLDFRADLSLPCSVDHDFGSVFGLGIRHACIVGVMRLHYASPLLIISGHREGDV